MAEAGFTKLHLTEDVPDIAGANGIDGIEAHFASDPLGLEKTGISFQRIKPGERQPWGHRHREQEEIYVFLAGSGTAKLGDEEIEVGPMEALRVAPGLARNFQAGPDGLDLLAFGAPRASGDNAATDSEMLPGWWGDK
jgi:hypothetical protein